MPSEAGTALEMNDQKTLFLKQCPPGIQKNGYVVFEVPSKDEYILTVTGGFWTGKKAKIILK